MSADQLALLAGLLLAPMALVWLGHGFRTLSLRAKRVFWGGTIGHALGIVLTLVAMMSPPVWWGEGGASWRSFAVHWSMLLGALAGIAVGLALRDAREP